MMGMAVIAFMMLLSPIIAFSQQWPVVTVEGGYEYGMRLRVDEITSVPGRHERTDLPVHKDYNSTVRMGLGILLPRILGPDIGLEVRATAGYSTLAMRRERERVRVMLPDPTDPDIFVSVDQVIHYDVSARMTTLGLDLVASHNLFGGLYAEVGLWSGYRVNSSFKRYNELVEPPNAQFSSSDSTVLLLEQGTDFAVSRMAAGSIVGLGYDIPLFSMLKLRPTIRLHADINSIINYNRPFWRDFSLGGGLAMILDGNGYPEFGDLPPLEPPDRQLRASVDLYCQNDAGERFQTLPVRRSITWHRGYFPFIPYFRWDRGSEHIPDQYTLLSSAGQFTADSLAVTDPLRVHHNGLNVLGMRLRSMGGVVRLMGGTAAGEPVRLGIRRAERLRKYLHEVWGVDPSRVMVESDRGIGAHVKIAGAARELTAPVLVEWRSEDLNAPQIGVSPSVEGGAGLKSWELVIRHGRRDVARQSSGGGRQDVLDMGLILRDLEADTGSAELVAELTVIDSAGERAVALDRMPILMDTAAGRSTERTRTFFMFLPSGNELPGAIAPPMDSIITAVQKDSRISVHYHRLPAANAEAALRHAEQVAGRLGTLLLQHGLGHLNPEMVPDDTYEQNASPEASMFDAVVTVVVEGKRDS